MDFDLSATNVLKLHVKVAAAVEWSWGSLMDGVRENLAYLDILFKESLRLFDICALFARVRMSGVENPVEWWKIMAGNGLLHSAAARKWILHSVKSL